MREIYRFKKLQRTLVNYENRISNLEAELYDDSDEDDDDDDYCDRCDSLVQEKLHLESCLSKRRQTIEAEQQKNASLTASLAIAQQSLACCQQEKAALEQVSASHKATAAQWKNQYNQKVKYFEDKITELRTEREAFKTKLNAELKTSEAKNTELKAREVEIAGLKCERDVFEENIGIQNQRDLLLSENAALQVERSAAQSETTSETITENMISIDLFELENKWVEIPGDQMDNEYMEQQWNLPSLIPLMLTSFVPQKGLQL